MSQGVNAWVLNDLSGAAVAVAEVEMVEYITGTEILPVPLAPAHCPAVMPWRGRLLPVVRLERLFGEGGEEAIHHLGVLAYQLRPGEPLQHLAMVLGQAPYRVAVGEQPSAALPERYNSTAMAPLVRSVFTQGEDDIAVLDVGYLASAALRDSLFDS